MAKDFLDLPGLEKAHFCLHEMCLSIAKQLEIIVLVLYDLQELV